MERVLGDETRIPVRAEISSLNSRTCLIDDAAKVYSWFHLHNKTILRRIEFLIHT